MLPTPSSTPTPTAFDKAIDASKEIAKQTPGVMEKIPKMVDDVLGVLAQRFGATGEYLWRALVRYQFAYGVADVLISLIFAGMAFFMFKVASKHYKTAGVSSNGEDPNTDAVIAGFSTAAFAILAIIAVIFLHIGIISMIAPEGAAIKMVLNSMRSNSQGQ